MCYTKNQRKNHHGHVSRTPMKRPDRIGPTTTTPRVKVKNSPPKQYKRAKHWLRSREAPMERRKNFPLLTNRRLQPLKMRQLKTKKKLDRTKILQALRLEKVGIWLLRDWRLQRERQAPQAQDSKKRKEGWPRIPTLKSTSGCVTVR